MNKEHVLMTNETSTSIQTFKRYRLKPSDWLWYLLGALLLFVCVTDLFYKIRDHRAMRKQDDRAQMQWNTLAEKSKTHRMLVSAYFDCRHAGLLGGSIPACLVTTRQYADLKQVPALDAATALDDIEQTAILIRKEYSAIGSD
jgi:hypothetical protein